MAPITALRGWLDRLASTDRLAIAKPGTGLVHELAAIADRLGGRQATLFPRPGGHAMPVVAGLTKGRSWMAEAMGVAPADLLARFQHATANLLPCVELEHLLLGGISCEASMLSHLQRSFPNVRDVHLGRGGVMRYHLAVQIKKRSEGEAKNIITGAFVGHYDIK